MKRHRWGEPNRVSPHKTECECLNGCGIVQVRRHEVEGGRDKHWTEFWRGLDQIEGKGTPECTGVARAAEYGAREYPL